MNQNTPVQPSHLRGSMVPLAWAGHPLLRPVRRVFGKKPAWRGPELTTPQPVLARRICLLALVVVGSLLGTQYMIDTLPNHGNTLLEELILVLFGILFAWISAGFWTAMMGAWVMIRDGDARAVTRVLKDPAVANAPIDPSVRTGVIMPICNEHVATVFAGMRATYESLVATGAVGQFDFYVLSDTNQPDVRAAEQAAWTALNEAIHADPESPLAQGKIYYRWRQLRTKRKVGNVSDFCRRWGRKYKYMIVLDADSVMTGDSLVTLVKLMEAHQDAGIIQTAPRAAGHETMHARAQQFGSRVYGPLFTAGMHFWQLGESHYWGHNAIIRIEPFMRHCVLAPLPGTGSLSGEVLSHDFVEAALMRRAGWKVWIAYDVEGSFEQFPPNLVSEVGRDRRWCQGNLQNARLMFEPGLHPVHRSVFITGLLAYLSSPLWLSFLLLSTLLFATHVNELPKYFTEPYQLFPIWPTANLRLILMLVGLTATLLIAPKALALLIIIGKGQAKRYGGAGKLLLSGLLEFLHSMLLAPVRMLFHTQFVAAAVMGIKLDWKSPPREDDSTPWGEAWRRHGAHTVFAAAWIAAILYISRFPWFLTPIVAGLLLSAPLSVWTSRLAPGRWLMRRRIFVIPEEGEVPPVLTEARRYVAEASDELRFTDVVVDAQTHEAVTNATPARPEPTGAKGRALEALVEHAANEGPQSLTNAQRLRLLANPSALRALREKVLVAAAHPDWTARLPDGMGDSQQGAGADAPALPKRLEQVAA
ncbi:glucans biosynthesis glucosyltransferase MdoH [soil metagenome]